MTQIDRASVHEGPVLFTSAIGTTPKFEMGSFSDALLIFPTAYTATSISVYAYHGDDPAAFTTGSGDDDWKLITTLVPVDNETVKLPDKCFAASHVAFVTNSATSDTEQMWIDWKG